MTTVSLLKIRKAARFLLSKIGQPQPHFHSKATQLEAPNFKMASWYKYNLKILINRPVKNKHQ